MTNELLLSAKFVSFTTLVKLLQRSEKSTAFAIARNLQQLGASLRSVNDTCWYNHDSR